MPRHVRYTSGVRPMTVSVQYPKTGLLGAALCAFATCACASGHGVDRTRLELQPLAAMPGTAVLEKSAQKYASSSCYEDTGTAKLFVGSERVGGDELRFWTSFRRGDFLRFSFRSDPTTRAGFEHANGLTKTWYEENDHRREIEDRSDDSLKGAVERFAGTSNGVSRVVPMLLVGHDSFRLRAASTHILETKVDTCGYDQCYSVLVQHDPKTRVLYVVDRDFILRGIQERRLHADEESTVSISISSSCVSGNKSVSQDSAPK